MSNAVPPADSRAHMRITTDQAAKTWRDGCAALCQKHPRYQTLIEGGPSGRPNFYHLLGAARKCGFANVTDDNVGDVIVAIGARAAELVTK